MDFAELVSKALNLYELALASIERGDYTDACEKAWACIETLRKTLLVKAGISYDKAKSITYGIPLFTRLLRKLGRKDLLEKYTFFNYKLHVMEFYEGITEIWEIEEIIQEDLKEWIHSMLKLIEELNVDLHKAEEILKEIEQTKRKLINESARLFELRAKLDAIVEKAIISEEQKNQQRNNYAPSY